MDLISTLRRYQGWMKDGTDGGPSIDIDDIDGDETFGAAANEIARLRSLLADQKSITFKNLSAEEIASRD